MSNYKNLLASKDETIKALKIACIIPTVLAVLFGAGWMLAPSDITLHYPPDLSSGIKLGVNEIPKANVYGFTYYIFQQLNRWPKNGEDDYFNKIHNLGGYLTPSCFQDRLDDYAAKKSTNELANRQRAVWEIPGRGFTNGRVRTTSGSSWVVSLDVHVEETYRGEKVKDRLISYPIKVVRYNADPELNPWGLALDCYADIPRNIIVESKEQE